jgi:nucleoside-diphosphate-sugar epimerase
LLYLPGSRFTCSSAPLRVRRITAAGWTILFATREYRFGDTRHILSDISALQALGWEPRRGPSQSVAAYAAWLEGMEGLDGVLAAADARMRALGVVRKARP